MASLRSYFLRFMIKHVVGPKFKRAGNSSSELRKLDEFIIQNQKVPAGTDICPVLAEELPWEQGNYFDTRSRIKVRQPTILFDAPNIGPHSTTAKMGSRFVHLALNNGKLRSLASHLRE